MTRFLDALRKDGVTISTEARVATEARLLDKAYVACVLAKQKPGGWAYKLALAPGLGERREAVAEEVARRLQRGTDDWQIRSDGMRQLWFAEANVDPWITGH